MIGLVANIESRELRRVEYEQRGLPPENPLELDKVWEETEEEDLVPVVKIVKGTKEDSGRGAVKFEEGFLPFTQAFSSLIGFL